MAEGSPKEMVDMYKKVLVNQLDSEMEGTNSEKPNETKEEGVLEDWKHYYTINPNIEEYGSGKAEIIDFAIITQDGTYSNVIEKGTRFTIKSKVLFHEDIQNPIFTYTFKDIHGTAITGTNTMYEKVDIGTAKAGEIYVATFVQDMFLQGGEYLLSISCTGYNEGDFTVYHRMYDLCSVTVVSDKNTVGFYDMNSKTSIEKVER